MTKIPQLDPFAPGLSEEPYLFYERLRREDPIHWSARNAWVISRYTDVASLLADERLSHWVIRGSAADQQGELARILDRWLELMNPHHRSRLRKLTQRVFSPSSIKALSGELEELASSLLRKVGDEGEIDLVRDYAAPLSLGAIGALLGIPAQRQEMFRRLAGPLTGNLFQLLSLGRSNPAGDELALALRQFLLACLTEKERNPGEDLMSALFVARESGDAIDREDFLSLCMVFLFAGYENTKNFISSSALTLLRHPDQLQRLREDPALLPSAVEELLRYESPVQIVSLSANEELEVCNTIIRSGQQVLLALVSANRDPEIFEEPDRLDLGRRDNPHLGFGHGPFFCLGAPLARLEGQVALRALLANFASLRQTDTPLTWRGGPPVLRGLQRLPLLCRRSHQEGPDHA